MTENNSLQEAYKHWISYSQEPCRCKRHGSSRFMSEGFLIDPAPEEEVCQREKAWRRYVELRDGESQGWASQKRLRPYKRLNG